MKIVRHDDAEDATQRLARMADPDPAPGKFVDPYAAVQGVVDALTWKPQDRQERGLPSAADVTAADTRDGMALVRFVREEMDWAEQVFIEAAKDRGMTWADIGAIFGQSAQSAQQRYKRLGGTRTWPTTPPRKATGDRNG